MKTPFFIFVIVALAVFGCRNQKEAFRLVEQFEEATRSYYDKDATSAATALADFVDSVEKNGELAERSDGVQYKKLLDMSYLRLASVYEAQQRRNQYDQAINRAIYYFDQDPHVFSDASYQRDKSAYLMNVLNQLESRKLPAWKQTRNKPNNK